MIRASFIILLLLLNLILWGTPILLLALLKVFTRGVARRKVVLAVVALAERWAATNQLIFDIFLPRTRWEIDEIPSLRRDAHYLVISNHRSWLDIFVVLRALLGRVAFLRFFLKRSLIWFPFIGQACWALEFPFMRRYTADELARHPEKRGQDLETTRQACERYRTLPVTILNFLEGTRLTREKQAEQDSPYRHLLRPRLGGAAFVLSSLGDILDGIIDMTIIYPSGDRSIFDFVRGRVPRIVVRMRLLPMPHFSGEITEPGPAREEFRDWIERIWREKDEVYERFRDNTKPFV